MSLAFQNQCVVSGVPLFHCIDMDWKQEGYVFQFSSTMAEEAETTILTLLPTLEHMYPTVNVKSNFIAKTVNRCKAMKWDDSKKMVIDTSAQMETENIEEEKT